MTLLLNTDAVPPQERLAYWTDLICNTYVGLECDALQCDRFAGSIESQGMPGLDLSVVVSGAQKVVRTPRQIARANDDYFLVNIQMQGAGIVRQDGRDALLNPGDFTLYDSTRVYELHFDGDFQQIVLKLPGEQLRRAVGDTEKLTATTISGRTTAGHLMISMIKTLWNGMGALEPVSAVSVAGGVLNILVAGLQTLPASKCRSVSSLASYHIARIKAEFDSSLRNPALSVRDVARDLGMSVGHIHRLFQHEAITPAQYIRSRRLEMCSRELLDPRRAGHSISEVAYSWGFNDAAHFSRVFRNQFGVAPREWRHLPAPI